ncbi:MAG: ATP-binding protein, partial [Desulfuromusa sp.]|nr:ATP-binding protein [Desulfuromusa sp.]
MNLEIKKMADKLQEHSKALENSLAEQTRELTEKNNQLDSVYRSIQKVEARRKALNEITRNYLTNGDLEQSLELLVVNAAQYVGALAGRFLHCTVEKGETKVTSVSKMCWSGSDVKIENLQAREAFEEYAQSLIHSAGNLLTGTLINNQTMFLDANQYRMKRSIPLPAGHPEIESLALIPISIGGETHGVIALANCPGGFDTSQEEGLEAFAAEAALLIHADSRETARCAAEETARLRSTFFANMSHELRTPLNVIIGMNKLLREMNPSSEQLNYLGKIGFSANQLLALITDILDLAKISEGEKLTLKNVTFQPEEFLYGITQLLAFRQANRKVELHADISPEIPPHLIGDSLRLTQILNNLLGNALKFTPEGSATLRVVPLQKTAVQVTLSFSIVDTGIGMTAEQIEKVFQPFVQVDTSPTREHGGSGLGLAISQQLCQLMGGDLSVESTPGQGSTFHFELPFKIDLTMSQEKKSLQLDSNLQGSSVLIVNSCPACCDILPSQLEAMQFEVDSVSSSSAALMRLNDAMKQGKPYPLVLIGLFLDEMTGLEFVELLTEHDFPDMKKILLANPADIAKFSERKATLGITEVVSIPASPDDLFKAMKNNFDMISGLHSSTPPTSIHWQQVKVLLVDDNEMGRELGRALLQNVGIEVYEAENGLEAVDQVRSGNFDLVLMDIQMPEMDGL